MPGRHHVLLIGIDAYDGGGMLTGCVNDIDAVQRVLVDRVGVPRADIRRLAAPRSGAPHETDVPEEAPTLDTIRAALTELGGEGVGPEDRVLVYYSGHGTQTIVTGGDGRRFSREALVPKDKKRGVEYRLLFDWELNGLIARIAARTPSVTVVLDSCCSAGATRDADDLRPGQDRFWPIFEPVPADGPDLAGNPIRCGLASGLASVPRCQVIAACQDDQRARESTQEGGLANGELTRAFVARLAAVPDGELQALRWGGIWRDVDATVRAVNPRQSPWLSGSFGRRIFGFGPDEDTDPGFSIVQVPAGYRVGAGTLAGVTTDAEVAVYGPTPAAFPAMGSPEDRAARRGTIRVAMASPGESHAVAIVPFAWPEAPRGRLVRAGRAARLRVALVPQDPALVAAFAGSDLAELAGDADAELTLARRADGGWALTDDVHGTGEAGVDPVLAVIPADRLDATRAVVAHYLGYITPVRMARACLDLPGLLQLQLLDCGDAVLSAEAAQDPDLPQVEAGTRAPYELTAGRRVAIAVTNGADVPLSVALIDCAASGRVLLLGEKRVPKRARHVFWYEDILGQPFVSELPDNQAVGVDRIVAIATTRADLPLGYLARRESFAEVMAPAQSRGPEPLAGAQPVEEPVSWTSAVTAVRISR